MKAKVYVLMYHNFHSEWDYCGVYGSRQQAEYAITHYAKEEQSSFSIEEEEVELPEEST